MACIELRLRGRGVAAGRWREHQARAGRVAQRRAGLAAQLVSEQLRADLDLPQGRELVAVRRQAAHEQLLVVLVERVARHTQSGKPHGLAGLTLGEPAEGLAPEQLLVDPGEPAPLDRQPGVEGGCRSEVRTREQLAVPERARGRVARQGEHVDLGAGRQVELERIAVEDLGAAERAAQLHQRPAERTQRVLRIGKQQLGERQAGHWALS